MSIQRARELRQNMTVAQQKLWQLLRRKQLGGLKFRRQSPIGPYIAEFFCPRAGLVVELDGESRASDSQLHEDEKRARWMASQGIQVLRLSDRDVYGRPNEVLDAILRAAAAPRS